MSKTDLLDNKIKNARVILRRKGDKEPEYLLVQEQGGLFGLPGGVKDLEDQNILETIKRELKEELDLDPGSYSIEDSPAVYEGRNIYMNPKSERFGKDVTFYIFAAELSKESPIKISSDLMSFAWCSEEEALAKIPHENIRAYFREAIKA